MFNFYIQSLCIIVVYHSIPTTGLDIKLDIEDIIDKILTSDRINILIERVADRAVEKIKSQMRPESSSKVRQSPPEQRYSGNREKRPNILRNEAANVKIKDMHREKVMDMLMTTKYQKPTERLPYRGQPGKIDNQAVKEKYASFPYEQLSLKYNKFINKDGREREVKPTERTTQNYEERNNFETVMLNKPERPERQERVPMKKEKQYEYVKYKSEEKKSDDFDLSAENQKGGLKFKYTPEEENVRDKVSYSNTNYDNKSYRDSKKLTYFADSKFKAHSAEERKPKEILPESLNKGKHLFKDASVEQDANDDLLDDVGQNEGSNEDRKEEKISLLKKEGERLLSVDNAPDDK